MLIISNVQKIEAYKRNYFDKAIADIYRAVNGGCIMGSFTLLFCVIDSLSIIEYGEDVGHSFNKWTEKWLQPYNPRYLAHDRLYAARCSLIHTYGVSKRQDRLKLNLVLTHIKPLDHLEVINDIYLINLTNFLAHVSIAAFKFFDWLKTEKSEDSKIWNRLNRLMQLNYPSIKIEDRIRFELEIGEKKYSEMSTLLELFDVGTPTSNELTNRIHKMNTINLLDVYLPWE